MTALVCDICGGKLRVGEGKTAVCESCGVEHSLERMRQKYKEVKGVVHVDNAHLAENYFALAKDAYDAGNKGEAERYCNKIIETSPEDSEAYFLKGRAVGWQSSLACFRFREASICFANAVNELIDDESKKRLHSDIQNELRNLITSRMSERCNCFSESPSDENADGFKADLREVSSAIDAYESKTGIKVDRNYVFGKVASVVRACMTVVSSTNLLAYSASGTRDSYARYTDKTDSCIEIMQRTIDLCDDDEASDAELYEQIIECTNSLLDRNQTDQVRDRWGAYNSKPRLSDSEVASRQKTILEARRRIELIRSR